MEERRVRIGSLFEWLAAAAGVVGLIWLLSVPAQRILGPRVEAALVETPPPLPPGVPAGAASVPVMLLLDGREVRQGELQSRLQQMLPQKLLAGPVLRSNGEFGDRQTLPYVVSGTKFYVVCERTDRGGPMRISGIYLP